MVRQTGKQSAEDKKDGKKKSSGGGAKKKPETGSWPCKIDGCKKVFAREADLKRHQRTTKTHSIPGLRGASSQCPQCDATFTRTDALRRHQKSRHNGVVIEPSEEKGKHSGDGASSGSRSPSPGGSPSRSHGEGSTNGSPPATQTSNASSGPSSYYRPHTMQDGGGYYAGYPPPPRPQPPGMMMDPHYPPSPIGLPTSATRSHPANWQPPPIPAPSWGPNDHAMPPPPAMYMPSYYPSPYYRHPGMPLPHPGHFPPQINPDLLSQSDHMNGVAPPESALRDTSPDKPESSSHGRHSADMSSPSSADPRNSESMRSTQMQPQQQVQDGGAQNGVADGPDASAFAALQAVLAFQKEQEMREEASRRGSAVSDGSVQPPPSEPQSATTFEGANDTEVAGPSRSHSAAAEAPDSGSQLEQARSGDSILEAGATPMTVDGTQPGPNGEPNGTSDGDVHVDAQSSETAVPIKQADAGAPPAPMEQLLTEDGMPMLNPAELLTQESLASPPAS